jgi:hypothetical protein
MKNTLFLISFLIIRLSSFAQNDLSQSQNENKYFFCPPTDTIRQILTVLDVDQLVGKPIDSLIAHLPSTFQSRRFTLNLPKSHRVKHVRSLVYSYKNGDKVEIFVKRYQFMNPIDPNEVWDFNLFRKETAFVIQITSKDGFHKWAKLQE